MSTHRGAVVVGLDAGPDSRHGLVWAADAAVRLNRPLHLMHAIDGGSYEVPPTVAEARRLHERAEQLLADASAAVASSVADISTQIVERSPVPALLDASRDAAVVVLGARGHTAVSGLLLGSVSLQVSQHAERPVVVAREQAEPAARRVVVGVDGSADGDRALGFAVEMAASTTAPVVALHGWHADDSEDGAHRRRAAQQMLDEAVAAWTAKYPEVDISCQAVPVPPAELLVDASSSAALIVVGVRSHGGLVRLLGSVSRDVLHRARCPVAVAR